MAKITELLKKELERIDSLGTTKRKEKVIEGFSKKGGMPKAILNGQEYAVFNSNDYMGLRFSDEVRKAEEYASEKYGCGPGAVRFISGTMKVHRELEKKLAEFHNREDGMIFSSAFAVNMAVIHCFIKGQCKDSLIEKNVLVVSDELNHRSIIDGIRVAGLNKEDKAIFKHLDMEDLRRILEENKGKYKRVIVVTDGIFSMIGEFQDIDQMNKVVDDYRDEFEEGIITIVDDSHGVASFGKSGRGVEENSGKADILIATMGKGFGVDGGYCVGDKEFIDYLKESAATYIYSNPISPGTAGAALKSVEIMNEKGKEYMNKLMDNITYFQGKIKEIGLKMVVESSHAIQPVLVGDSLKAKELVDGLYKENVIVTNISYPVVPKGKDEIRVQISRIHTKEDIDEFIGKLEKVSKEIGLI